MRNRREGAVSVILLIAVVVAAVGFIVYWVGFRGGPVTPTQALKALGHAAAEKDVGAFFDLNTKEAQIAFLKDAINVIAVHVQVTADISLLDPEYESKVEKRVTEKLGFPRKKGLMDLDDHQTRREHLLRLSKKEPVTALMDETMQTISRAEFDPPNMMGKNDARATMRANGKAHDLPMKRIQGRWRLQAHKCPHTQLSFKKLFVPEHQ